MVAALRTAAGKQPHSRFVSLGTRPADPEHWFSKALAGGCDYAQSHAARPIDGAAVPGAGTWRRANPSLRVHAGPGKRDPSPKRGKRGGTPPCLAAFEALRLNLGTADTEVAVLLDAGLWAESEGEARHAVRAGGLGDRLGYLRRAIRGGVPSPRRRGRCNASPRSRNRRHSTSAAFAMVYGALYRRMRP